MNRLSRAVVPESGSGDWVVHHAGVLACVASLAWTASASAQRSGDAPGTPSQSTERLYSEACDAGDLVVCNVFGLMYEYGDGVPRDVARAAARYSQACEGGELVGCTNLGVLYEAGMGVERDVERAAGLYRVACEGGELLACAGRDALRPAPSDESRSPVDKQGWLADAETGATLAEGLVELPDLGVLVVTGAEGRITLPAIPPGRHALRAERLGYETVVGEVVVPGDSVFYVLLTPTEVTDQQVTGRVEGRVTDPRDRGISDVDISVIGQERARTLSNRQGRFAIRDVEPGLVAVRFSRLGYAPRTATLIVKPGRTVDVVPVMSEEPIELEPIQVTVRSAFLEQHGFYSRAARGFGRQFSPADLANMNAGVVSDVLRRAPLVRLQAIDPREPDKLQAVSRRASSFSNGPCVMGVYVDGIRQVDPDVNQYPVEWFEAMEVYQGPGTPIEYAVRDPCGVVLLWSER